MSSPKELEELVAQLDSVSTEIGAMVVDGELAIDSNVDRVLVSADVLFKLAKHLSPRIVYANIEKFNAESQVASRLPDVIDVLERRDLEEDEQVARDLSELAKKAVVKWRKRDGELYRVVMSLVHDGIVHESEALIDWDDEFSEYIDSTALKMNETVDRIVEKRDSQAKNERDKLFSSCIKTLKGDERFTKGRTKQSKRLLLAKSMFPDVETGLLQSIVRQAEAELWLDKANERAGGVE